MKKGDVVQLKCGGPKMVILEKQEDYENVEANEQWFSCEWIDSDGNYKHHDFPESSLELSTL